MTSTVTVHDAFGAVVQDLGREEVDRYSLQRGGASDAFSLRVANMLVGNHERAAGVEVSGGGLVLEPHADVVLAVTGAACRVRLDGSVAVHTWAPYRIPAGTRVEVSAPSAGFRVYVAFAGGLVADRAFGSVAPLPIRGFGTPVSGGDTLTIAPGPLPAPSRVPVALRDRLGGHVVPDERVIDVLPGLDEHVFDGLDRLYREEYTMSARSNAVGARLHGDSPVRVDTTEILSRSIPYGSIEIPARGEVIVLLRSRVVTAGYPVPGVVSAVALDRVGQLAPGEVVRFRPVDEPAARRALRAREQLLDDVRALTAGPAPVGVAR